MEKIDEIIKRVSSFDDYLDKVKIKCLVQSKKELYLSAEGLLVPCGWLHDRMYGEYVKDSKSSKQFWDVLDEFGGKDRNEAQDYDLKQKVFNYAYDRLIFKK